ncbi:MAG: anthranilate synthase component II [Chitinophagaceae bacterium]
MNNILILDNYDSFTYNLVQMVEEISNRNVDVHRNDEINLEQVAQYDKIILSPGPGIPSEAGILLPLIKRYAATKSIFGVCLGHQAIGEAFGAELINLSRVYHGVSNKIKLVESVASSSFRNDWFKNLNDEIEVGRYHSWVLNEKSIPADVEVTAEDESGMIMALRHRAYDVQGVQFHPESVLTPLGRKMMENWLGN